MNQADQTLKGPQIVFALYKPHDGKDADLCRILAEHVPTSAGWKWPRTGRRYCSNPRTGRTSRFSSGARPSQPHWRTITRKWPRSGRPWAKSPTWPNSIASKRSKACSRILSRSICDLPCARCEFASRCDFRDWSKGHDAPTQTRARTETRPPGTVAAVALCKGRQRPWEGEAPAEPQMSRCPPTNGWHALSATASRPPARTISDDWRALRLSATSIRNSGNSIGHLLFPGIREPVCVPGRGLFEMASSKKTWHVASAPRRKLPDNRVASRSAHSAGGLGSATPHNARRPSRRAGTEAKATPGCRTICLMPDHLHFDSAGLWKSHSKTGSSTGKVNSRRRIASG